MVVLALNRVRSPYSCNTFLPVNYSQVTRDQNRDAVLVVTFWLTVLPLRFTVCPLYHRLSSELLIIHPTVHFVCHAPLISTNAFQRDERYRQCLHVAEERLVMKELVCRPVLQLRVRPCMLRISMRRTVCLPVPTLRPSGLPCFVPMLSFVDPFQPSGPHLHQLLAPTTTIQRQCDAFCAFKPVSNLGPT
jgi:hypothetical protein